MLFYKPFHFLLRLFQYLHLMLPLSLFGKDLNFIIPQWWLKLNMALLTSLYSWIAEKTVS